MVSNQHNKDIFEQLKKGEAATANDPEAVSDRVIFAIAYTNGANQFVSRNQLFYHP